MYGLSQAIGMKYVIWRPFNIITPYESAEKEQGMSHVFADFVNNLVVKKMNPLPIIGSGDQIRCFTWIDDVARLIGEFSFDDKTDNEEYNIGNPEPITMKELALLMYEGTEPLQFETVREYKDDVMIRIPDVTKAIEQLGFEPSVKVKESIERCLTHIRGHE